MKIVGKLLVSVGLIWTLLAWNMNTAVNTESTSIAGIYIPSKEVYNFGLIEDRRNHIMLASVTIVVGVLLLGFGILSDRSSKSEEPEHLQSKDAFVDDLPSLYTGRGLDAHEIDDLLEAEKSLRAAGLTVRRDGSKWILKDESGSISYLWNRNDLIAAAKTRGLGRE